MQMRNRTTPPGGSPRLRAPNGGGVYKDKAMMGNDPSAKIKNMVIAGLAVMVVVMFFMNGNNNGAAPAATQNPNAMRGLKQDIPVPDAVPDVKSDAGKQDTSDQEALLKLAKDKAEAQKLAQEHHDQEIKNINQANAKALDQKGVEKKEKKGPVRDADGDIIEDDMLIKDIQAGRVVIPDHKLEEAENDIAVGEDRWNEPGAKNIPKWLKEYFDWHKGVVNGLTKENWRDQRYFAMTCLGGEICGNVAHRLRPLMAMLRIAADSKRVFYIHWDMPDRLEKYLHPPNKGGVNWTIPEFVMWKVRKSPHQNTLETIEKQAHQDDRRVVNVMYNDDSFAEPYYNQRIQEGEVVASQAFHDVWNVLFKPSFMLTERISESLRLMGLKAGEYATAHIDYELVPRDDAEQEQLRLKVENAMNCMSNLRPGGPFLVAAQTYAIAREAIVYGKQHNVVVHAKQIAHDTSTVPTDMFTSFVEIMLMADTRCVAYNRGGYGQLGYILGYDYNCRIKYSGNEGQECQWKDPPAATMEQAKDEHKDDPDK